MIISFFNQYRKYFRLTRTEKTCRLSLVACHLSLISCHLSLIACLFFLSSCINPFNPNIKSGENEKNEWFSPVTPDNVLKNLMLAYNQKSIDLYKDSLDIDFRFYVLSQQAPEIGQDWWGYEQEIEYHTNLFSKGSTDGRYLSPNNISLHLEIPPAEMWQLDNQMGHENWIIIACHFYLQLNYLSGNNITASGYARFHLRPMNDRWYIAIWIDESYI